MNHFVSTWKIQAQDTLETKKRSNGISLVASIFSISAQSPSVRIA